MKKSLLILLSSFVFHSLFAQWSYTSGTSGPIYYNGGSVGVGVTSPAYKLDVNGSVHSNSTIFGDAFTAGNVAFYARGSATGVNGDMIFQGYNQQAYWITGTASYLYIGGNGGTEPSQGAINIDYNGNVGVGTKNTTAGYKFAVDGTAVFDGITVKSFSSNNPKAIPWADYVFDKDYKLPTLQSLADFIKANRHLPGIPTTAEVQKDGLDIGASQAKLLEKIEQLTLYTIDLQQQVTALQAENRKLADLQAQIDALRVGMTPPAKTTR